MVILTRPISCYQAVTVFFLALLVVAEGIASEGLVINSKVLRGVHEKYGPEAAERVKDLQALINDDDSAQDTDKLEKVNNFFNQYDFIDDIEHWGKSDYWATPIEFLATRGGDCEDFTLAKYFTLRALGIPDSKLFLTYVKAIRLNQAHMVLTYYSSPVAEPLILDNLNTNILAASRRTDLLPVYTFNGDGLWLAKQRGKGKFVGDSNRMKRWNSLKSRMATGL
jgi:predicted transglutaminase-like cysteine proteinase